MFTFRHLAHVFIQSNFDQDTFYLSVCSFGIKPMTLTLLVFCSTSLAAGILLIDYHLIHISFDISYQAQMGYFQPMVGS